MQSNYVLTVFGISFFEVLQYGVPSVVFSPYYKKDDLELNALSDENVTIAAKNMSTAIINLKSLMNSKMLAYSFSKKSLEKLSINGAQALSKEISRKLEF